VTTEVEVQDGRAAGYECDAADGIWEVALSHDQMIPIRPRRFEAPHPNPIDYIYGTPSYMEVQPVITHKVEYHDFKSGYMGDVFYVTREVYVLGGDKVTLSRSPTAFSLPQFLDWAGYRGEYVVVSTKVGDRVTVNKQLFVISSPPPTMRQAQAQFEKWKELNKGGVVLLSSYETVNTVTTAKAIIQRGMALAFVREEMSNGVRLLDLVGGVVEGDETADQAMSRECYEETGLKLKFTYLAEVHAWEEKTLFRTQLYWTYLAPEMHFEQANLELEKVENNKQLSNKEKRRQKRQQLLANRDMSVSVMAMQWKKAIEEKFEYCLPMHMPSDTKPWITRYISAYMGLGTHQYYDPAIMLEHTPVALRRRATLSAPRMSVFFHNPYLRPDLLLVDAKLERKSWTAEELKQEVAIWGYHGIDQTLLQLELIRVAEIAPDGKLLFRQRTYTFDTGWQGRIRPQ